MQLENKIELEGDVHGAVIETSEWPHGIQVKITLSASKIERHSAKILCSASMSSAYSRVESLSEEILLEEAWKIFKEKCQDKAFAKGIKSKIEILIPWPED